VAPVDARTFHPVWAKTNPPTATQTQCLLHHWGIPMAPSSMELLLSPLLLGVAIGWPKVAASAGKSRVQATHQGTRE
jgi:hypothetical protein